MHCLTPGPLKESPKHKTPNALASSAQFAGANPTCHSCTATLSYRARVKGKGFRVQGLGVRFVGYVVWDYTPYTLGF